MEVARDGVKEGTWRVRELRWRSGERRLHVGLHAEHDGGEAPPRDELVDARGRRAELPARGHHLPLRVGAAHLAGARGGDREEES